MELLEEYNRKKQIYTGLSERINLIDSLLLEDNLDEALKYFAALKTEIDHKMDEIDAMEVAIELMNSGDEIVKLLTGNEQYREIAVLAKRLNISYAGVTKHDLIQRVNERILEGAV